MDEIQIEMRITDCRTTCRHCLVCGTTGEFAMPLDQIEGVLRQMRESPWESGFFPLDDLVAYPDWIGLLELMNAYEVNSDVLTTTGAGGVFASRMGLLRELGKSSLQLAFHGLATTHDQYVGRRGAFDDLFRLLRAGIDEGFGLWIMVFLGKHNLGEVTDLIQMLTDTGVASEDIGVTTAQYLGRAVAADPLRLKRADLEGLPERLQPRPRHYTESEWLDKVYSDDDWDRPAFLAPGSRLRLFVDKNLDVYLQNWNPYGLPGIKHSAAGFRLGTLAGEPLEAIVQRYSEGRPRYLRLLEELSVRELASLVGRAGDIPYPHLDVPQSKWPYLYLRTHVV